MGRFLTPDVLAQLRVEPMSTNQVIGHFTGGLLATPLLRGEIEDELKAAGLEPVKVRDGGIIRTLWLPAEPGPIAIPNRDTAIAAAHAAAESAAELLRYAREGDCATRFALEPEILERLTDALKMAIEVEMPATERRATDNGLFSTDNDGLQMLGQLHAACARFLEGWA